MASCLAPAQITGLKNMFKILFFRITNYYHLKVFFGSDVMFSGWLICIVTFSASSTDASWPWKKAAQWQLCGSFLIQQLKATKFPRNCALTHFCGCEAVATPPQSHPLCFWCRVPDFFSRTLRLQAEVALCWSSASNPSAGPDWTSSVPTKVFLSSDECICQMIVF